VPLAVYLRTIATAATWREVTIRVVCQEVTVVAMEIDVDGKRG
jgi:hypothetical protein